MGYSNKVGGKVQIVDAVRPIQAVNNGVTRPFVIQCNDGNYYYTKFKENPEGTRVLANEYVCAKIAQLFELPLASPSLIRVNEEFLHDFGNIISEHILAEELSAGLHFGTKKINKTFPIANAKMLEAAKNIHIIPELIMFDQLICNLDRDSNGGNLIFDQANMEIVVIDHSHVFEIGALWDAQQLSMRLGGQFIPFASNGYIFRKLVPFVRGNNPFDSILDKMSRMTDEDLWHIISAIPHEWMISEDDRRALHSYLSDRLHRINECLSILKPILPYWKGGN